MHPILTKDNPRAGCQTDILINIASLKDTLNNYKIWARNSRISCLWIE